MLHYNLVFGDLVYTCNRDNFLDRIQKAKEKGCLVILYENGALRFYETRQEKTEIGFIFKNKNRIGEKI